MNAVDEGRAIGEAGEVNAVDAVGKVGNVGMVDRSSSRGASSINHNRKRSDAGSAARLARSVMTWV
ncbi:MAG TPA: hypothetical protein VHV99_11090, partial [Paraburkholderia sp.]|nr:hypothetical protein [Paraburkholderia sp.]